MISKRSTNEEPIHVVHADLDQSSPQEAALPPRSIGQPTDYPWYDDRVTELYGGGDDDGGCDSSDDEERVSRYDTPKAIYSYLDGLVWKQEDAKKTASVILYQCLRGIRSNALFIGPTGCGKTHIWRCLRQIFPDRIAIVDGSNVTQDGWKGNKKWSDLLRFPAALSGIPAILVVDEADKMLAPKYTSEHENVSHCIQGEALTMLEGTRVTIKDGSIIREVDTSKISFVLCGAFSDKAHAKTSHRHIGFGAGHGSAVRPYEIALDERDLIDFGVMPEFLGRIQHIVSLRPMDAEDYYRMTDRSSSLMRRICQQYGVDVRLTPERRRELAEAACATGLGVRGMENRIRQFINDAVFEDCDRKCYAL